MKLVVVPDIHRPQIVWSAQVEDNPLIPRVVVSGIKGRDEYTSEQLLRALIVMFVEGDSYRDVVVRIDNSEFWQKFAGLRIQMEDIVLWIL